MSGWTFHTGDAGSYASDGGALELTSAEAVRSIDAVSAVEFVTTFALESDNARPSFGAEGAPSSPVSGLFFSPGQPGISSRYQVAARLGDAFQWELRDSSDALVAFQNGAPPALQTNIIAGAIVVGVGVPRGTTGTARMSVRSVVIGVPR